MSYTCVGDRFVFLKGWEEGEVKKNLGCEDFMMMAFRKLPLYYYKLYKVGRC